MSLQSQISATHICTVYHIHEIERDGVDAVFEDMYEKLKDVDLVYVSFDIDGLDPSVFPSTGTPVPGGLSWYQTLNLFESVAKQRDIIGFDIMEFAPIEGFHAYDFAASLLCYKFMGIIQRSRL